MIVVYTDGSCKPTNPGPCGYACILVMDNQIVAIHSEFLGQGTNNLAELSAIEHALDMLESKDLSWESSIIITDSKYAIGVLIGGWKANKNVELIQRIRTKLENYPNLDIQWIKGHSGDQFNDLVDEFAKQVIDLNSK